MTVQVSVDENVLSHMISKYAYRVRNMPLPKNFVRNKRFTTRPKYIVIHDSNGLNTSESSLSVDGPEPGIGAIKINDISKEGLKDINYHFIIDRIGNDYEIIAGRPINCMCDHEDHIESAFTHSLHVMILSDLNVEVPETRFYQILAYRCISPMMKMLKMGGDPASVIKFRDEISLQGTDKELRCPGEFLARELLVSQARRYL